MYSPIDVDLVSIFEKGEFSKVIDHWTSQQLQTTNDQSTTYIAAAAYFRLGDFEKACNLCENIEPVYSNDANFLSMYAAILRRLNLHSRAEKIFKEALAIFPDSKEVNNNYSNLLIDQGRSKEAVEILQKIVRKYPDYIDAKTNLLRAETLLEQIENNQDISLNNKTVKNLVDKDNFFGDPLDKAFEIDEVTKAGAKLGSLTASIGHVLSDPKQKSIEQAELDMVKLANDQVQSKQYNGALEIIQKVRSRAGLYGPLYKASSDAFIGLERFKDAEIHALLAYLNGEDTIANFINLASLAAMRKDQLMAQQWLLKAEAIDKNSNLVVQCKNLLFPENKSRESDTPFV